MHPPFKYTYMQALKKKHRHHIEIKSNRLFDDTQTPRVAYNIVRRIMYLRPQNKQTDALILHALEMIAYIRTIEYIDRAMHIAW